jgi:HK97 gp10 family phage protein
MFSACFEQLMGQVEQAMEGELRQEVLPEARRLVPVKTGKLQASIDVGVERDGAVVTGYVEAGEPYAPYVEFGTGIRPAKAFLRPAVERFDLARVAARMKGGE